MHDQEFEKQVHQKMEELSLSPSDAVWTNVEGQLHEKKRRRKILWLPFLFLFWILGGYFSIHHLSPAAHTNPVKSNKETANTADHKRIKVVPVNEGTGSKVKNINIAKTQRTKLINREEAEPKSLQRNQPIPSPAIVHHASGITLPDKKFIKHPMSSGDEQLRAEKTNTVAMNHIGKTHFREKRSDEMVAVEGFGSEKEMHKATTVFSVADTLLNQENPVISKDPYPAIMDTAVLRNDLFHTHFEVADYKSSANLTVKLSKKHKLSWGFSVQAGKTSLTDGKLNKLFTPLIASDNLQFSSSATGGMVIPPAFTSGIQARTGFSSGFFLRKRLNSRYALSTGMNYTLFTTSLVLNYSNTHINRYHFVELPLLLQTQLNKGEKTPLIWEAGMTISQLIASNALHYDSTVVNRLSKDSHLFNHTQVSFVTGLYLQIFSFSNHPFQVGPQLQYGITHLTPGTSDKRNHLFEYGIKISTVIK